MARRVTPIDAWDRVARLLLAGSPSGWDAERVLAFKIIGLGGGIVLGFFVTSLIGGLAPFIRIVVLGLLAFVGFMAPDSVLNRRVEERQKEILRTLSDTLDLLTISVEAGLSLNAAIAQVVQNVPGVLSSEFARMLQEIQLGVPRADAFRNLAERTDVEELNAFALAMIQADVFGVSIASVLRTQAQQLRIKRRQAAEAKAQQTPVKIVPLILCILPALFVVIVGPGAIQIWESFIQGEVGPAAGGRDPLPSRAMKVAYQGEPGAYSERAVRSLFADAEPLPCATVRHAFSRVTSGRPRSASCRSRTRRRAP